MILLLQEEGVVQDTADIALKQQVDKQFAPMSQVRRSCGLCCMHAIVNSAAL